MSNLLLHAAMKMREDYPASLDSESPFCECGPEPLGGAWFDRSICPEPCGSMHYICNDCTRIQGRCMVAETGKVLGDRLARTIRETADLLEGWSKTFEDIGWPGVLAQASSPVFSIARAYLGEKP